MAKAKLTPANVSLLFNLQSLALDVHVLSAPLFLLAMSAAARQELFAFLGIKWHEGSSRLFSHTTTSAARVCV
jgi:hypothetical protein